jgi:hypothetical protein
VKSYEKQSPQEILLPAMQAVRESITQFAVAQALQLHLDGPPSSREYSTDDQVLGAVIQTYDRERLTEIVKDVAEQFDGVIYRTENRISGS